MATDASFSPSGRPQALPFHPPIIVVDYASSNSSASPPPSVVNSSPGKARLRRTVTQSSLSTLGHGQPSPSHPPIISRDLDSASTHRSSSTSHSASPEISPRLVGNPDQGFLDRPQLLDYASAQRLPSLPPAPSDPTLLDAYQLHLIINEVVARLQSALQTSAANAPSTCPTGSIEDTCPSGHDDPTSIPTPPSSTGSSPGQVHRPLSSSGSIPVATPYVLSSDLPSSTSSAPRTQGQHAAQHPTTLVLEDLRVAAAGAHQKLATASEKLEKEEHALRRARRAYERAARAERERGNVEATGRVERRDARNACKRAEYAVKAATVEYKTAILAEEQDRRAYLEVANAISRRSPRSALASVDESPAEGRAQSAASSPRVRTPMGITSEPPHHEESREPIAARQRATVSQGAAGQTWCAETQQQHCSGYAYVDGQAVHSKADAARPKVACMSRHVAVVLQDAIQCSEKIHELAGVLCPGQDFFSKSPSEYVEIALEKLAGAA